MNLSLVNFESNDNKFLSNLFQISWYYMVVLNLKNNALRSESERKENERERNGRSRGVEMRETGGLENGREREREEVGNERERKREKLWLWSQSCDLSKSHCCGFNWFGSGFNYSEISLRLPAETLRTLLLCNDANLKNATQKELCRRALIEQPQDKLFLGITQLQYWESE